MPASPLDSALYGDLFGDAEMGRLFTDTAEVRAMLLVEGALAKAQGDLGLIPADSAAFLHRAMLEVQIDPAGLAAETGANAVPVPALVAAARKALEAPDHTQYLHWGATSQDVIDTGLMLRLRQAIRLMEARLDGLLEGLATLAEAHADLPMAARTYAQVATPTSFGAVVASWGNPLLRQRQRLENVRRNLLMVSLSGAAGTNSAIGPKAPEVRAALAQALNLGDPGQSWHSTRDSVATFANWITITAQAIGKLGEDLILLSQSGIEEVSLGAGGASSTMPQKANPVGPSVLVALARQMVGLNAVMTGAALHRQQRDATAWLCEWLTLPQMCLGLGRMLLTAGTLAETLAPNPDRMLAPLQDGLGLLYAEAVTFALAEILPRPEAQAAVKALTREARDTGTPLPTLAAREFPAIDWARRLTPAAQLGHAPAEARAFAAACR
ncbi:MAG: adenylosuccinate lyase family protein [Paracoccaceae bacterium]|nr:adenylosuccinate lyase family protein [Paracoccaceae bacterium]